MRTVNTLISPADAQADLSLSWVHIPFCWFCRTAAHISLNDPKYSNRQSGWSGQTVTVQIKLLFTIYTIQLTAILSAYFGHIIVGQNHTVKILRQ